MDWQETQYYSFCVTCASEGRRSNEEGEGEERTVVVEFISGCVADLKTASTAKERRVTSPNSTLLLLPAKSTGELYSFCATSSSTDDSFKAVPDPAPDPVDRSLSLNPLGKGTLSPMIVPTFTIE